jgi:hypothetical protein
LPNIDAELEKLAMDPWCARVAQRGLKPPSQSRGAE